MADGGGPVVGVLGSYGGRNQGDEAILTALLADLRSRRPDARILVFSRDPQHTTHAHPGVEAVVWEGISRADTTETLARMDLLLLGGGGILYDSEARRYLRLVLAAQERGLPVFTYAMGCGPLTEAVDCAMVRDTVSAAAEVTVRDEESKLLLEEAGVMRDITVTADPALMLEPEEFGSGLLRAEGVPGGRRLVGISVREPGRAAERLDVGGYHRLLAQVSDFLVHRLDASVLFVPMERDDIRHAHGVLSHMTSSDHGRILHGDYRPRQLLGLMRHFDLAVGMRLHFLIFAALAGVPLLPLPYAGKVFDFAQRVGAPALRGVEREVEGPLLAEVDRLWDERTARIADMTGRVAWLRDRAWNTGKLLDPLLAAL
nr:polysaccharide pyruvyl transferase family protein [Micromonospora sp. DSM 115978]